MGGFETSSAMFGLFLSNSIPFRSVFSAFSVYSASSAVNRPLRHFPLDNMRTDVLLLLCPDLWGCTGAVGAFGQTPATPWLREDLTI